jgi:hypothetical protein
MLDADLKELDDIVSIEKRENLKMFLSTTPMQMLITLVAVSEHILLSNSLNNIDKNLLTLYKNTIHACRKTINADDKGILDTHEGNIKDKMAQLWGDYNYIPTLHDRYVDQQFRTILKHLLEIKQCSIHSL